MNATATQKGEAAEMRTYVTDKATFAACSNVVHSGDQNPHKHGPNPYADKTNSFDPAAQKVIDSAKAQSKK